MPSSWVLGYPNDRLKRKQAVCIGVLVAQTTKQLRPDRERLLEQVTRKVEERYS